MTHVCWPVDCWSLSIHCWLVLKEQTVMSKRNNKYPQLRGLGSGYVWLIIPHYSAAFIWIFEPILTNIWPSKSLVWILKNVAPENFTLMYLPQSLNCRWSNRHKRVYINSFMERAISMFFGPCCAHLRVSTRVRINSVVDRVDPQGSVRSFSDSTTHEIGDTKLLAIVWIHAVNQLFFQQSILGHNAFKCTITLYW